MAQIALASGAVAVECRRHAYKLPTGFRMPKNSECLRYSSQRFEAVEAKIEGARHRYMFVQCASCGGVVGILNYQNVPSMINQLAQKLGRTLEP